jgi:hypothetical protein
LWSETSPELSTGVLDIKIQAAAVDTGNGMKNRKLKSKDFIVSLASHSSNLPTIATVASTSNLMVLSSVVISKTGASTESCPGIPRTGGQLGTGYVRIPFFTVGD